MLLFPSYSIVFPSNKWSDFTLQRVGLRKSVVAIFQLSSSKLLNS